MHAQIKFYLANFKPFICFRGYTDARDFEEYLLLKSKMKGSITKATYRGMDNIWVGRVNWFSIAETMLLLKINKMYHGDHLYSAVIFFQ